MHSSPTPDAGQRAPSSFRAIEQAAQTPIAREGYSDDEFWVLPNAADYLGFEAFVDTPRQLSALQGIRPFPGFELLVISGYITRVRSPRDLVVAGDQLRVREAGDWEFRAAITRLVGFRVLRGSST